jgi:hypothetical protein
MKSEKSMKKTTKSAFALLQETLRRATSEKTDFELTKSKLSSVLLGDQSQMPKSNKIYAEQVNPINASKLPEPPVVVYVKEIGKAGI